MAEHDISSSPDQLDDPDQTIKSGSVPEAPSPGPTTRPEPAKIPRSSRIPPPPVPVRPRESQMRGRTRRRQMRRRNSGADWAWVVITATIFVVVIIVGMTGTVVLRSFQSEPTIQPTAATDPAELPTAVPFRTGIDQQFETGEVITLDNGYSLMLEPWDGESRFTILAMGIDRRPGETGLAYRTDTMMVISLDPATQSIGILSIPRDLYVAIPGYAERQRVNTPMYLGEARNDITGPELAMQTVQYNLGIRIHDYLVVDFNAVIGIVDAIGGIDVTLDYTINDPEYPDMNFGYDPFYLEAGTHHLDGYNALRFARTRHGTSDIDRAGRQQQTIFAIRDRVLNFDMLPQLIFQAPTLLDTFQDNVYTKLTLPEMIQLAWYVKDIHKDNIVTGVIGFDYLQFYETPNGSQVLIPNQRRLGGLMAQIFGPNYTE